MRFADSADDNDKLGGGTEKYKTKIAINSNGSCKWMAPAIFQSTCEINTKYFPFDDQVGHLNYGHRIIGSYGSLYKCELSCQAFERKWGWGWLPPSVSLWLTQVTCNGNKKPVSFIIVEWLLVKNRKNMLWKNSSSKAWQLRTRV